MKRKAKKRNARVPQKPLSAGARKSLKENARIPRTARGTKHAISPQAGQREELAPAMEAAVRILKSKTGYQVIHRLNRGNALTKDGFKRHLTEEIVKGFIFELSAGGDVALSPAVLETIQAIVRSADDRTISMHAIAAKSVEHLATVERFDRFIIEQAGVLGWRIVVSDVTQRRLRDWEYDDSGPARMDALGAAFGNAIRILQTKKAVPLTDPGLADRKRNCMDEFRVLRNQLKSEFGRRNTVPTVEEVLTWVEKQVRETVAFPFLAADSDSLCEYLQNIGTRKKLDPTTANRFVNGEIPPAEFFDRWLAHRTGTTRERARQVVSHAGRTARGKL